MKNHLPSGCFQNTYHLMPSIACHQDSLIKGATTEMVPTINQENSLSSLIFLYMFITCLCLSLASYMLLKM